MPFSARWMILLMGICSIYMGMMYNELASIPLDVFGTSYHHNEAHEWEYDGSPYPFGLDPVWRWSGNVVQFTNSLKMKLSVIVGFLQMTFGVVLKLGNAINGAVGDSRTAIHESIPELIIYVFPFGYLITLVIIKWCTDWENVHDGLRGPPAILSTFISFFMFGEVQQKDVLIMPGTCERTHDFKGAEDGLGVCQGQTILQRVLLCWMLLCIPWLLLVRPFLIKADMNRKDGFVAVATNDEFEAQDFNLLHSDAEDENDKNSSPEAKLMGEMNEEVGHSHEEEEEESFADIMVHQGIHTIEYCLGTVSNTASYLRLWALSLAHSQLSEVFWDYIFNGEQFNVGLNFPGTVGIVVIVFCYFMWFMATMGVLMCMESLSAFLHALRLQWVEFQSKFYAADGVLFVPAKFTDEEVDYD